MVVDGRTHGAYASLPALGGTSNPRGAASIFLGAPRDL